MDFTESDIVVCLDILEKTLGKKYAKEFESDLINGFNLELKGDDDYSFLKRRIAVLNGKTVAIAGIYRLTKHPLNYMGVDWFSVDPRYQRNGIGKKLMNWMIEEAINNHQEFLFVWATEEAVSFYNQFGFVNSDIELTPRETKILLIKKLSSF